MLYVFVVSSGIMMKFDMSLAVRKVLELKNEIAKLVHIPVEEQVLLCSGGEELKLENIVGNYYGAGTDTNPIFLFYKSAADMDLPYISSQLKSSIDLNIENDVQGCESMSPSLQAALVRVSLAQRFAESAANGRRECDELVHGQHLQQQGWAAVIANLEDAKETLLKRKVVFEELFEKYSADRSKYQETIKMFPDDIKLLGKVPLLPKLLIDTEKSDDPNEAKHTLLSWFCFESQEVLESLMEKYQRSLDNLDDKTLSILNQDIEQVLQTVDNPDIKEVKGIEERLTLLNKQIDEAKKLEKDQKDLAHWFAKMQAKISCEPHVLPEAFNSFQQQLKIMLKNHKCLRDILERCTKAKLELSDSINIRVKYICQVENDIYNIFNRITLLEQHLKCVVRGIQACQQIHSAPERYLKLLAEVCRRKMFSAAYIKWATELSSEASKLYEKEVIIRKEFNSEKSKNMVDNLFPGMDDFPPAFAADSPNSFDDKLPNITKEDLEFIKLHLPELSGLCEILPVDSMPSLSKIATDSAFSSKVPSASNLAARDDNRPDSGPSSIPSEYASLPNDLYGLASIPYVETPRDDPSAAERHKEDETSDTEEFETVEFGRNRLPKVVGCKSESDTVSPLQERIKASESADFQAAEYYIDDSMPSSYTESNATSPMTKGSRVKSHHMVLAELQRQVDTRDSALATTVSSVKSRESNVLRLHAKMSALQKFILELQGGLQGDLSSLKSYVDAELKERASEASGIVQTINTYIEKIHQQLLIEKDDALSIAKNDFDTIQKYYLHRLEVEGQKLNDAENQLQHYEEQFQEKSSSLEETKHDIQELEIQLQEKSKLVSQMMLEHELEFDNLKTQLNTRADSQECVITQLKQNLLEADSKVLDLESEMSCLRFWHREESEKQKCAYSDLQEEYDKLKLRLKEEENVVFSNTISDLQAKLHSALSENETLKENLEHTEKKYRETCASEKENAMEMLEDQLKFEHKSEMDTLCAHIRATLCLSLSVTENQPASDVDIANMATVMNLVDLLHEKLQGEKLSSINKLERTTEMLTESVNNNQKLQEVIDNMRKENEEALERIKSRTIAESQVTFNEAINSLSRKKDSVIDDLRSKLAEVSLQEIKSLPISSGLPAENTESVMSQSDIVPSVSSKSKLEKDAETITLESTKAGDPQPSTLSQRLMRTTSSESSQETCESLKKRFRAKEEEFKRIINKVMKSPVAICLDCENKISVFTCNVGDVVLVSYEESHENYSIVHFGQFAHFLHSDSLQVLGLKIPAEPSQKLKFGVVTFKEFCATRKPNNRYKVTIGTKFYRIKVRPWDRETAFSIQQLQRSMFVCSTQPSEPQSPSDDGGSSPKASSKMSTSAI